MNRRQFLRATGGACIAATVGPARRAAAHPGPFEPYGRVGVAGAKEAVPSADGRTAFVAATTGYASVDVSTPDRPELLAEVRDPLADREDGPFRELHDAKVDGDTLVVVGPANPRPGAPSGALVVDVADPADPVEVAFHETDVPVHNCFLADGRAYLTANDGERNPLVVLDVESGDELGRWSLVSVDDRWADVPPSVRAVHDVWVHDDTAFVAHWDAGTWILDVSNPTDPVAVGSISPGDPAALAGLSGRERRRAGLAPPGNHHYVATDETGALLGVGVESWAVEVDRDDGTTDLVGGPGGVDLWDVSDPTDPAHLSHVAPPASPDPTIGGLWTTAHNFDLHDGTLYTSWYRGGVKRHDVSDPTDPVELSWWRDPARANFWTARYAFPAGDEGVFVASSWGTDDAPAAVYTFPDHDGAQPDPPGVLSETTAASATTTAPPATATATPHSSSTATTPTNVPGFGPAAGAAALGAFGALLRRRRRGRD